MEDLTPIDIRDVVLRQRDLRAKMGLGEPANYETVNIATEKRMAKKRERYERCLGVSGDILEDARAALAMRFRFLDRALWHMPLVPSFDIYGICSDGVKLYYDPEFVVDRFRLSFSEVVRDVIHCLFHCIFRHPFMLYSVMREPWDVACDIAVESMLIDLVGKDFPSNYDGRATRALNIIRAQVGGVVTAERLYHFFSNEGNRADLRSLAPLFRHDSHGLWYGSAYSQDGTGIASVARQQTEERQGGALPTTASMSPDQMQDAAALSEAGFEGEAQRSGGNDAGESDAGGSDADAYEGEPSANDAPGKSDVSGEEGAFSRAAESSAARDGEEPGPSREKDVSARDERDALREEQALAWEEMSRRMQVEIEATIARQGDGAGNLMTQLKAVNRDKCNYEDFLRRFSVLRERMAINDDEFDYIYYTYGLNHYGNMPLVEPLEYKDSRAVYDFVIALDTSESCSGDLIKAFVRKTYGILSQSESFHSRVNIHIVQCDARIQSDVKIESLDKLDLYLDDMELRGFGGTDFRPVFEYVNLLCEKGEFADLRGLVYFTDGMGTFPRRQPAYDAVFVFVDDGLSDPEVPPWAFKVLLDERAMIAPSPEQSLR